VDPFGVRSLPAHRRIGRAYYLAREIAPDVADARHVLDVGCGKGFVAYHLGAMLGCRVDGVDLIAETDAPIPYRQLTGDELPYPTACFDAVLFCYVLHHTPDPRVLLREAWRVLRPGGRVVVYEDMPVTTFDRALCRLHELMWSAGTCTFLDVATWCRIFAADAARFELVAHRAVSRFRDPTHPVRRHRFVLQRPPHVGRGGPGSTVAGGEPRAQYGLSRSRGRPRFFQ